MEKRYSYTIGWVTVGSKLVQYVVVGMRRRSKSDKTSFRMVIADDEDRGKKGGIR